MCAGLGNPYAGKPQQPGESFCFHLKVIHPQRDNYNLKCGTCFANCSVCPQVTDKERTLELDMEMEIHMEVRFKRKHCLLF